MRRLLVLPVVLVGLTVSLYAQTNPVPFLNQPLVPASVAPGSPGFTLTVNGTGFVSGAVVNWNGSPLTTTFVGASRLTAGILATNVANPATVNITVTNPAPGGGTSSPNLFTVTMPTPSVTFATSTVNVGLTPGGIVAADFNNDGKTDLAVLNTNQPNPCYQYGGVGTIQILVGNGAGGFSTGSNTCFPELGPNDVPLPLPVLISADFGGKGKVGLAADYYAYGDGFTSASIFLNNGDGTLSASSEIGLTDSEQEIVPAFADFNREGLLDTVFIQGDGDYPGVYVVCGSENESCNPPYATGGIAPVGNGYRNVVLAGDFNGDNILDLGLLNFYDAQDVTLRGPLGIVLGGLGYATTQPSTTLVQPVSAVTADFNGDGVLDLAFADPGSTGLPILKGNGDGTFTQLSGEPPFSCTDSIAAADLNGDGKLDLVCLGEGNTVEIFLGNGDGTFQPPLSETVGNTPLSLAIGDFNGDGRLDIAVANSADNTVTILLQTSGSTTVISSTANPASFSQPITLSATVKTSTGVSATGAVTFFDGTNNLGTASLSNNVATLTGIILATGSHTITATYSGGNSVLGSTSAPLIEIVNPAMTATSLISSANPVALNKAVIYTATVTSQYGGAVTGTVTLKDGITSTTVSLSGGIAVLSKTYSKIGTYLVTATYSGDANNVGSTSNGLHQYVERFPILTSLGVNTSASPTHYGQSVTFTARVTSEFGSVPDGEVIKFYDDVIAIGSGVTANGKAQLTTSQLKPGIHAILAIYTGDGTFSPSGGAVIQVVTRNQ
jgi:hypothetical protein